MKNIIAFSALCALSMSVLAEGQYQTADRFSGAYVGLGAGFGLNLIRDNGYVDTDASSILDVSSNNTGAFSTGFAGQVFAGYGMAFSNQLYLGADIFYQYLSPKTSLNATTTLRILGATVVQDTLTNTLTQKNSLGLAAHIGYVVEDAFMPYLLIGSQYTQTKSTYTSSNTSTGFGFNNTSTYNKWGLHVGAGMTGAFGDNWLGSLECDYVYRGKQTQNLVAAAGSASPNSTLNATFRPNMLSVMARLGYRFTV